MSVLVLWCQSSLGTDIFLRGVRTSAEPLIIVVRVRWGNSGTTNKTIDFFGTYSH